MKKYDNSYDTIYIFDFCKRQYVQIQETTEKHLRQTHKFSVLWLGDTFINTKNI